MTGFGSTAGGSGCAVDGASAPISRVTLSQTMGVSATGGMETLLRRRRIVAESYQPGVSVSVVARRNDVNANLVFTWRRQFREQAGGAGGLVPVVVEPAGTPPPLADAAAGAVPATGRIEIALADGSRVIVDREVDGSALARVLAVLARR